MRLALLPLSIAFAALSFACSSTGGTSAATAEAPLAAEAARNADRALVRLIEGNARFADGKLELDVDVMRRAALVQGQHPFATVLGCADSRVVPELLFDQTLGDLFVIRVAGNVVAEDEAGSIEYAVEHLDTPLVLVLGHEGCGAVTAAVDCTDIELIEEAKLIERLKPSLKGIDRSLPRETQIHLGVEANVRRSVHQLMDIARRENHQDRVRIMGAVYELDTGRVRVLDIEA